MIINCYKVLPIVISESWQLREPAFPWLTAEKRSNLHDQLTSELYCVIIRLQGMDVNISHGLTQQSRMARRLQLVQHCKISS